MSKNLAEVKSKDLTMNSLQAEMQAAMDYSTVEATDVRIPKLLMMQPLSKMVEELEVAKSGDLVNSITAQVYTSTKNGEALKVVPIHMFKDWVLKERVGDKYEYRATIERNPENENSPWDYEEDGKQMKRVKGLNFYVMVESDLGKSTALPHVMSFRSTTFKEGENLANHFFECKAAQQLGEFKVPFGKFFEISSVKTTNDHGTWNKMTAKIGTDTNDAEVKQCFQWYKTLKTSDHSDIDISDVTSGGKPSVDTSNVEF